MDQVLQRAVAPDSLFVESTDEQHTYMVMAFGVSDFPPNRPPKTDDAHLISIGSLLTGASDPMLSAIFLSFL